MLRTLLAALLLSGGTVHAQTPDPIRADVGSSVSDLHDIRGPLSLGPLGAVHGPRSTVLFPKHGSNAVEVAGREIELPGRVTNGVIWAGEGTLAYPISTTTIRFVELGSGAVRDFTAPLEHASVEGMSDGSVWYRDRRTTPDSSGVEWTRLTFHEGRELVVTPLDMILVDGYGQHVLLLERGRNAAGGRTARIVSR